MTDHKQAEVLKEGDLDTTQGGLDRTCGGGLLDTEAGTFGAQTRYIGETEKGVWKAPAGLRVTQGAESKS